MTELSSPPRLPGAARARAYAEPSASPRPEPEPSVVADPDDPVTFTGYQPPPAKEAPAEFGRRQKLIRVLSFGLVHPQPGREEQEYRKNCRIIREGAWTRSMRIAICSPKGSSGKTPTALILGGILASQRGGSVAVWDACDAAGTLAYRAGGQQSRCVSEIAQQPDEFTDPATISTCAATQTSYADVLASLGEREFTDSSVRAITGVLDRTYRMQVADTANTPHSAAYRAVLELADILVVPTTLTADSVNKSLSLLQRLQENPANLAQRAVVVLSHFGGPVAVREAHELFAAAGVGAVIDVPFDPHIVAGVEIDLTKLSRPSRLAWTRAGASVVANLTNS
jgi:MinD-like ATPase involved in chromosome partitioning or flagellar assembly